MRLDDGEKEAIKKDGLRWGVLKCLHITLCRAGYGMPNSVKNNLEVIRSIIETGCHGIKDLEELLNRVEDILTDKMIYLFRSFQWYCMLLKAKNGELTRNETMIIPYMRSLIRKHEFLDLCIPTGLETTRAIEASLAVKH